MWANTGFYPFLFANFGVFTFLILVPIALFFRGFDGLMKNVYASVYVGMIGSLLMVNGSFSSLTERLFDDNALLHPAE